MSQKTIITRVRVHGHPYIGKVNGADSWSDDPNTVMEWLCDSWRYRFNTLRSREWKYWYINEDNRYNTGVYPTPGEPSVFKRKSLNDNPDWRSDSEIRADVSWCESVPAMILHSAEKIEKTEWITAVKRRKTLRERNLNPGAYPGFKRRKDDKRFVSYHKNGSCSNANLTLVNKNHGYITITGRNKVIHRYEDEPLNWCIQIKVKLTEEIRDYTSIRVNWTKRELVFTNEPVSCLRDDDPMDGIIGLDPGIAHFMTDSDGNHHDLPVDKLKSIDRRIRLLQRAQSRAVRMAGYDNEKDYRKAGVSRRFRNRETEIKNLYKHAHNIVEDYAQKLSTQLVREHAIIAIEDTRLANLMKSPAPVENPLKPGHYLPNGRAAKRGLNHLFSMSRLGAFRDMLVYKAAAAGRVLTLVPSAFTSQRCSSCGYTDAGNRESQAVYHCLKCNHVMNADVNAAVNMMLYAVALLNHEVNQGDSILKVTRTVRTAPGGAL